MRSWLCRLALLAALPLAGCNLYFGGDDQPPPCGYGDDIAEIGLVNPDTGQCEWFGGGGGGGCGPAYYDGTNAALPNWAQCPSACEGLDEQSCLGTSACRAEYTGYACPPNADCIDFVGPQFLGCVATAPSGPIEGGDCWGLDAQTCSEHDDCASTYQVTDASYAFNQCFPEPYNEACAAVDCGPGSHCELQCTADPSTGKMGTCAVTCVPDGGTCANIDCGMGSHCEELCSGTCDPNGNCPPATCGPTCVPDTNPSCAVVDCAPSYHCEELCTGACPPGYACDPVCSAQCLPDVPDPGTCYDPVACDAAPPACPIGTTPGVSNGCWTGYCIPESECGRDPGTCDGVVLCDALPPACPVDTVPGVRNGCWSGYCIPASVCGTTATCEALTDEMACLARPDCAPIYDGMNCTCDPNGVCTCTDRTFARCESAVVPL